MYEYLIHSTKLKFFAEFQLKRLIKKPQDYLLNLIHIVTYNMKIYIILVKLSKSQAT